jgi:hypothetical protein
MICKTPRRAEDWLTSADKVAYGYGLIAEGEHRPLTTAKRLQR